MWRVALREDGASGSVNAGPARPGLLIALIPNPWAGHDGPRVSLPQCHTLCHCEWCRTGAWSFRGIMEALSKQFHAQLMHTHGTHQRRAALPQVQVHGPGSRLLWHTV